MESSVVNTGANITGTADFLIGKPLQSLGWEDNFISEWNSYYQDKAEEKHQDVMEAAKRTGKGRTAEIAGEILTFLGEAGIDTILSGATGGALAAAKFGSKGGKVLKYADDVSDLSKLDFDDVSDAGKSLQEMKQKVDKNNLIESMLYQNNKINEVDILRTLKNAEGKTIIEVKHAPGKYKSNNILQIKNKNGGIDRDYYDDKGDFIKQISNNNHNHKSEANFGLHGEHAHDHYMKNGKRKHGKARELTEEERRENADIL